MRHQVPYYQQNEALPLQELLLSLEKLMELQSRKARQERLYIDFMGSGTGRAGRQLRKQVDQPKALNNYINGAC